MANELRGVAAHSAEYFGDTRDYFWHDDFIAAVSRHWPLETARAVLDVGCGVGHWGRVLGRALPGEAHVTGIDREPLWIEEAAKRALEGGGSERFDYRVGSAERLPFADAAFDLVTCQTLLMHVSEPSRVLAEMTRVVKPGGLIDRRGIHEHRGQFGRLDCARRSAGAHGSAHRFSARVPTRKEAAR